MSNSRRKTIVIASTCFAAGIGAWLWLLIVTPESEPPTTSAPVRTRPAGPGLDTAYRPPAPSSGIHVAEPLRPAFVRMLAPATQISRRIEILDGMEPDLTEAEAMALIHELSNIPTAEQGSAWHSTYIHKLCNLLQDAGLALDAFANALATVAADRDLPVVYRDYAFQHLRILWNRTGNDGATDAGQARMHAIEDTFRRLLDQRPETAAQSLLGLHEIRQPSGAPAVPDQEIARLAIDILDSPPIADSIAARMTAVRVLAERRIPGHSPVLRDIASSDAEHSLVRASAVAALGFIGEPTDLEFLETLPSDNPVIAGALRHAGSGE